MSPLALPLRRICHSAATISVGGIMVARGMTPVRLKTSRATSAPATTAARVRPTLDNRKFAPRLPEGPEVGRSQRLLQIGRQELLVDQRIPVDRLVGVADQFQT